MSQPVLLLRVAATWPLPGLGLLALAAGPTPYLAACALHTLLGVEVRLPDSTRYPDLATVEEVAHAATVARGLLLDLGPTRELPVGTTIWLAGLPPALAEVAGHPTLRSGGITIH